MALEVAPGKFGQRFIPIQHFALRRPFIQQHKGVLFALQRAETDQPFQRCLVQNMVAALVGGGDARLFQGEHEFRPCDRLTSLQQLAEDFEAAGEYGCVKLELPAAVGAVGDDARRQQGEHPTQVRHRHDLQRAAHCPGACDAFICHSLLDRCQAGVLAAQADRPLGAGIILRLHGPKPGDYLAWQFEFPWANALVIKPVMDNILNVSHVLWGFHCAERAAFQVDLLVPRCGRRDF